ncbi:hypothetical protein DFP74_5735 [Nocardiopsis sp. Huas11]|uniref:hypothetical protein n=1 Tax=Nocardiopsis sp. Huas11 TaxID=2183912 RepID=UPI000EB5D544|nr:hypothetical protein [Nocardiopsis sp. Huas11]RKS09989.1 hypothetical protein DFP74_5735 [Nocardiopsis sp. Huas11]
MYEDEPTFDELAQIEATEVVAAYSPTFWDTDAAEQVSTDPYDHPSWDVHEALTGEDGWDDPADAVEIRELLADDVRVVPLVDTPTARPLVRDLDQVLVLVLVPVDGSGLWPAGDSAEREVWAA